MDTNERSSKNWAEKLPIKPIIIVVLLFLIGLLVANLSGEYCRPYFIKNLGITETSQCCNPGVLIERLGYAIGGVIALLAVVIASDRAKASDKAADAQIITAKAQSKTAEAQIETVKAQEKRNIEDRYKNAISQFGNENSSVRLGGAYELYYLAKDSKYRPENICDVLCVHIRDLTTSEVAIGKNSDGKEIKYSEKYKTKPSNEVQSILDLLVNKDKKKDFPFESRWINLGNAYLKGANLDGAQFQGANLNSTKLEKARLYQAQLQGANLIGTRLQEAYLSSAQFQGADLWGAQLQGAILQHAELQGANLQRAELQGTNLKQVQLQGAVLIQAHLQGADLREAELQGANLGAVQLQGADLYKAQLQGAFFLKAQLQGAFFLKAQLQGAYLKEAQLQGANLNKTDFRGAFTKKGLKFLINIDDAINQLDSRKNKIDKIENAIFSGGVTQKQLDDFKKITAETLGNLNKIKNYNQNKINDFIQKVDKVKKILEDNIGKPEDTSIPPEAITGSYSQAEANEVITMLEGVGKELKKQNNPLKIHDFFIE